MMKLEVLGPLKRPGLLGMLCWFIMQSISCFNIADCSDVESDFTTPSLLINMLI